MIVIMQRQAGEADIERVVAFIRARGLHEHISRGAERTIIGAVGDERVFEQRELEVLPGVEKAMRIVQDWRIISRETQPHDSQITVRGVVFGGGMCQTVEPLPDDAATGGRLPESAAVFVDPFFRSGTPYTAHNNDSDHSRARNLQQSVQAAHAAGKPVFARIRDVRQLDAVLQAQADILYLGGELLTNRTLRDEVGSLNMPVVLCKDKHHQIDEWLIAAEHIALKGNHHIILGEAGTLSLDRNAPYRLDIEAIVKAKIISHLPVLTNILRLSHPYMPEKILRALSQAAGADIVITRN